VRVIEEVQLAVERPSADVVVIRVAGQLDAVGSRRVLSLVEQQQQLARSHPTLAQTHIVVDVSDVRCFAANGLDGLRQASRLTEAAGARLQVTGLEARRNALPLQVAQVIPELETVPTLDEALVRLDRGSSR
jgi:anti-anti-sigma regulatory factor